MPRRSKPADPPNRPSSGSSRSGQSGKGARTGQGGKGARTGPGKGGSVGTAGRAGSRRPGRYTPPIPRAVRRSPSWYPWVLLSVLVIGIALIILNYVDALPASPTNWYTIGGLAAILAGAGMATRYR